MDQDNTKPGKVRRLKGWFFGLSRRTQAIILVGLLLVVLGVVGGMASGGKGGKRPTTAADTGRPSAGADISEASLSGLHNYMPGDEFEAVIGKLGRPALTGRQPSPGRFSCKYMAAWKKPDGRYLLLHWLESTDSRTGGRRIESFRTWDTQTLRQVEDLKLLLK